MPNAVLSAARPAIFVDGVAQPSLDAGLIELQVDDSLTGPSGCRATIVNWGPGNDGKPEFLHFDRSVLDIGNRIHIQFPSASGSSTVFEGVVDALLGEFPSDQAPRITCCAVPALHAFRTAVRSRSFPNQTDTRVLNVIAGERGLIARVSLDSAPTRVPDQKKVSDLAFVLARSRALGAEAWLAGNELHVHSSRRRPAATVTLQFGSTLLELNGTWGATAAGRLTRGSAPCVVVTGMAPGTLQLHAGQRIRLQGVGPLFEGQYYLTRVSHRFSGANGVSCAFDGERVAD
jgi:phage protein D